MGERLTDRVVRGLPTPPSGSKITYDNEVSGFGARVTAAGAQAFVLEYRIGGRKRRITIGSFPDWTTTAAREEAKALKRRVDRGDDPMGERHEERAAPTMDDLCDRYIAKDLPKKRPLSQRDFLAIINTIIRPKLGRGKVADVRFADVERLHREVSAHAPVRANRVVSLLRSLFNLAIKWGYRPDNPCKGIEWNPEDRRERFLSPAELVALSAALQGHSDQRSADAIRLLLLTGARRGEVLGATWSMFDLDAGVWVKPSAHTKQGKIHRVPLSPGALEVLVNIRQQQDEVQRFVFPGDRPDAHLTDIKKSWAAVCKKAGIEGARLHDLRHSYASILASAGLSLPIIGALLGHTQPGTTARYSHLCDDVLRAATSRVGDAFAAAQAPRQAEVVPLAGGKR